MTDAIQSNDNPPNETVKLRAIDHLFIRDADTGEVILNQRGDSQNIGTEDDR